MAKGRKRLTFSAQLTEEHRCERTFYSRGSPWRSAEDTAELATEPQQEHKGQGKENKRAERNWQDVPGAYRAVVAKMGARMGDVAAQRRCVAVFATLARDSTRREQLMQAGIHDVIIHSMSRHLTDSSVQKAGAAAIAGLSLGSVARKEALFAAGAHDALVRSLRALKTDATAVQCAVQSIEILAQGSAPESPDSLKDQLVFSGCVAALVDSMDAHPGDVKVQRCGATALAHLIMGSAARRDAVLNDVAMHVGTPAPLIIAAISGALPGGASGVDAKGPGALVAAAAAVAAAAEEAAANGFHPFRTLRAVTRAMGGHPKDAAIQRVGVLLLASAVRSTTASEVLKGSMARCMVLCGAGPALTAAMHLHAAAEPDIAMNGARALQAMEAQAMGASGASGVSDRVNSGAWVDLTVEGGDATHARERRQPAAAPVKRLASEALAPLTTLASCAASADRPCFDLNRCSPPETKRLRTSAWTMADAAAATARPLLVPAAPLVAWGQIQRVH